MIIDLSAFSGEKFDPKKWINDACATRPEDEPVDKYLSEMEMKLQLLAGKTFSFRYKRSNLILFITSMVSLTFFRGYSIESRRS